MHCWSVRGGGCPCAVWCRWGDRGGGLAGGAVAVTRPGRCCRGVGGDKAAGKRHKGCRRSEVKADGRRESGGRREAGEWHKADRRHKAGERHTAGARPKSQGTCTKRAGRQETRFFVFRV